MKLTRIAAAVGVAFGLSTAAHATQIATPDSTFNALSIDWDYTSFLAEGGITAVGNFLANAQNVGNPNWTPLSTDFSVYTHAKMTTYGDGATSGIAPPGVNTNWELTIVGSFTETVTNVAELVPGQPTAVFQGQATSGFFQMYLDTTPDSNNLAGTGFNDGRLIAVGALSNNPFGNFTVTDNVAPHGLLDQNGADDWGGQQTVTGGGGAINPLEFTITAFDPTVFVGGIATMLLSFSNVSIILPFNEVDPSQCFSPSEGRADGDVGTTFSTTTCGITGSGVTPALGTVNGLNGPDFIAQTDYNSSFDVTRVPEPGVMALFGVGLIGLGAMVRRRKLSA